MPRSIGIAITGRLTYEYDMEKFKGQSFRVQNFKSFGPDGGGFSSISRMNIVIGRNNSGKSALIDLIDRLCRGGSFDAKHNHKSASPSVWMTAELSEAAARKTFAESTSGGPIPGNHWQVVGRKIVGQSFTARIEAEPKYVSGFTERGDFWAHPNMQEYYSRAVLHFGNPFSKFSFRRVSAERDVRAEPATGSPKIESNGEGLTSTIAYFINRAEQPSDLVEVDMLAALNEVFAPDAVYTNIIVQQVEGEKWEVYLIEEGGGRVALSDCGSGLKTILQVLACLILVPYFTKKSPSDCIFAFEELENNLHPALQRRLLFYIELWAEANDSIIFLTTHSNVVIDMFATKPGATITHVTREAGVSRSRTVSTYVDGREILDDLDVRASDLLQANGLVWLEGPSDRIYFNKWIELAGGGLLREGSHYQCELLPVSRTPGLGVLVRSESDHGTAQGIYA